MHSIVLSFLIFVEESEYSVRTDHLVLIYLCALFASTLLLSVLSHSHDSLLPFFSFVMHWFTIMVMVATSWNL